MHRRKFLTLTAGAGLLAGTYALLRPRGGFMNPCLQAPLPERISQHKIIRAAWEGIIPAQFWDCHVHLVGVGDGGTGARINPTMQTPLHPIQYVQYQFYLNAACAEHVENVDETFIKHLMRVQDGLVNTCPTPIDHFNRPKLMMLAFDQVYDENGNKKTEDTAFYIPNSYTRNLAQRYPDRYEWIASIHPYRKDGLQALRWCVANGARAVKWLPSAMGINPQSPLCDWFYDEMARHKLPLLVHAGGELAVSGAGGQQLGNPLNLRRPLDRGVKVIVAHCASSGSGIDLDQGENGPSVSNFSLFARLMNDNKYEQNLFGDISAITQINRVGLALETILVNKHWHARIINGSDYPLPAIMPLFSLKWLQFKKYITAQEADLLAEIRPYNPLLFDFILKRTLRFQGHAMPVAFFNTRPHFS